MGICLLVVKVEFCVHFHKIGNRRADWRDSSRGAIPSLVVFFMETDKCKSCLNTEFRLVCYYLGFDMLKNGVAVPASVELVPFFWFFHLFNRISIFAFFHHLPFTLTFSSFQFCLFCLLFPLLFLQQFAYPFLIPLQDLHIHSSLLSLLRISFASPNNLFFSFSFNYLKVVWSVSATFEIVRPRRN